MNLLEFQTNFYQNYDIHIVEIILDDNFSIKI